MTPDAAGIEAALAAGLAAHRAIPLVESGGIHIGYGCPAPCSWGNEGGHDLSAHRAHVAAALLPVVTQAQAEALRAAADRWTQGAWADVMLPKPTPPAVPVIAYANRFGDWLRARADESGAR